MSIEVEFQIKDIFNSLFTKRFDEKLYKYYESPFNKLTEQENDE